MYNFTTFASAGSSPVFSFCSTKKAKTAPSSHEQLHRRHHRRMESSGVNELTHFARASLMDVPFACCELEKGG